uniref:Alpha/beta hydrolase fold-3 domain-containing protein n=1 Tax=Oryza barthii TaxID=65489 RepID=A0A0D3GU59_9ORYZ
MTRRRRSPSLPCAVRVQAAGFALGHRRDGSVRRLFFSLLDIHVRAKRRRPDAAGVRSVDVTIDASRGLWARVFSPSPTKGEALPVVVFFHGGGFVLFSAASFYYDRLCRRICRELRAVVVSVNYRLAPAHRFPAAYDDGLAALRYLDANGLPEAAAVDLSSCFLAGAARGGTWCTTWRSAGRRPPRRRRRSGSPAPTDYYWREFLPEGATRDHPAAHVCGGAGGEHDVEVAEAFPAAMVAIGGFDLLKGWQARYVEALRGKGKAVRVVEYPGAIHGFCLFPELADSGELVEEMKLFVQEHRTKRVQ